MLSEPSAAMDSAAFRSDPFLRTSAYNMATWAIVNMLFSVPNYAMAAGAAWSPGVLGTYSIVLFAVGMGLSAVHERRVGKMVGPPGQPLFPAEKLWGPLLLTGFAGTVTLIATGRPQFIQPLWLLVVGPAYIVWGLGIRLRIYQVFGVVLTAAGLVALSMQETRSGAAPSVLGLHLWNLTMGAFALAVAFATNRRYLWFAEAGDRDRAGGHGRDS